MRSRSRETDQVFICSYENVPAGAAETMRSISHPSIRVTTGGSRQKRVGGRGRWNSTSSGRCFRVRTRVTPPAKKEKATWAGPASGAGSATCRRSPGNVNDRNNQQLGGRPALVKRPHSLRKHMTAGWRSQFSCATLHRHRMASVPNKSVYVMNQHRSHTLRNHKMGRVIWSNEA